MANKNTYPFEDLIRDNSVVVTELPKKTQDLIAKFPAITDNDAKDAMDQKIYLQIKDFLEEKADATKKAEEEKTKKTKKDGIDVSKADTATKTRANETPEEKAAREAKERTAAAAPKPNSIMGTILGRR
jgi:hypothetical protein